MGTNPAARRISLKGLNKMGVIILSLTERESYFLKKPPVKRGNRGEKILPSIPFNKVCYKDLS